MTMKAALLIIDVQNDFCPGGALPVPAGDRVVAPLNRAAVLFATAGLQLVVLEDAIAGVDITAGDSLRAMEEMKTAGASFSSVTALNLGNVFPLLPDT